MLRPTQPHSTEVGQNTPMSDSSHSAIDAFTATLMQAARSKSTDELLLVSIEQVLSGAKPRQAEILRRCAVPRWFDLSVLAVLREHDEGNERVIDLLHGYSLCADMAMALCLPRYCARGLARGVAARSTGGIARFAPEATRVF
ncbi:hypothetical protein HC891_20265 [Candidatus Gracilibacteria bacterium]|nr:hypothetical protein [Candidatus Gracilibacteria bacterium]